jgi:hypothetical protein
VFVRVFGIGI